MSPTQGAKVLFTQLFVASLCSMPMQVSDFTVIIVCKITSSTSVLLEGPEALNLMLTCFVSSLLMLNTKSSVLSVIKGVPAHPDVLKSPRKNNPKSWKSIVHRQVSSMLPKFWRV